MDTIQSQTIERVSHKELSISRVIVLGILGFLFGILLNILLNVTLSWYILPGILATVLAALGFVWKIRVYEALSLEGFTAIEWILWIAFSIAITPFITGSIGYYMYKKGNRYPIKWKYLNIALVVGPAVGFILYYSFVNQG